MPTEATTNETQMNGKLVVRSAGRTLKGSAHDVSGEYICCVNYAGSGRVRGFYGIADGVAGERGAASELTIETLKKSFRHIRESDSVNGSNLLPGCLEEVNSILLNGNTGGGEAGGITAAVVCGYIEGETAHIALAGGGAAYILENGKISRLTQDLGAPDLDEPSLLQPGQVPIGYAKAAFKPVYLSQTIRPESTLIFCSDGLLDRINSLTIQEKLAGAGSLDEAAELIVTEAHCRDGADDVGVVLARLEPPVEHKKTFFTNNVHYPVKIYLIKFLIITLLIAALAYLILNGAGRMKRQPGASEGAAKPAAAIIKPGEKTKTGGPAGLSGPTAELDLQTDPANARVFINGVQQPGTSPFKVAVPAGGETELRVEADGFEPYVEKLNLGKDTSVERTLTLHTLRPKSGSLLVICQPQCDRMEFDGHAINGFPRDQIMIREIAPGDHRIKAGLADETEGRSIRVVSGITQSIVLRFANEKISPRPPAANSGKAAPAAENQSTVDVVGTRPGPEKSGPVQIKKSPAGTAPVNSSPARDTAFFVIDTNVPDCTVMILENNTLVMTGFSGTRYDIKPGRYTIQVSKPGYGEEQRDVLLNKELQMLHFDLKKQ